VILPVLNCGASSTPVSRNARKGETLVYWAPSYNGDSRRPGSKAFEIEGQKVDHVPTFLTECDQTNEMTIDWQIPNKDAVNEQLERAASLVELVVSELEKAQMVSKETLERTISI